MLSFSAVFNAPDIFDACAVSEALACLPRDSFPDTLFGDERDERILPGASSDPLAAEARAEAGFKEG